MYYTTSLNIAHYTEKAHANVLKDIEKLIVKLRARVRSDLGNYFIESAYVDAQGLS